VFPNCRGPDSRGSRQSGVKLVYCFCEREDSEFGGVQGGLMKIAQFELGSGV
jgi:hypothetical protein